jgi:hypothetical protein
MVELLAKLHSSFTSQQSQTNTLIEKLSGLLEAFKPLFQERTVLEDALFITAKMAEEFQLTPEKKQEYLAFLLKSRNFPLPEAALILQGPRYLTLSEIASEIGIFSISGEPHAQVVSGILRKLALDTDEYRQYFRFERHGHKGASYQYLEIVIPKIRQWLEQENWPTTLKLPGGRQERTFQVQYHAQTLLN